MASKVDLIGRTLNEGEHVVVSAGDGSRLCLGVVHRVRHSQVEVKITTWDRYTGLSRAEYILREPEDVATLGEDLPYED